MYVRNIHEAKSHLSKLIDLAFKGEEVVLCKDGEPMVRLVKYQQSSQPRTPGYWQGKVHLSEDFDALSECFSVAFQKDDN